jgi:molybdopterin synthase sulfur carrier subunit
MKVLYFAWVKSKVGIGEESVEPPAGVATVGALLDWLAARSPKHAAALANRAIVRVAVNQEYVGTDHPVKPGDEVALFPPVTGG